MKRARSSPASPASAPNILSGEQRINKLLAAAGLGSRRQVDELIEQGRVEVNGVICNQLGMKVDVDTAKIAVDGTALKKFRPVYFALNKPAGVLCTNRDPQGRRRAIDFIPGHQRLFPVGRLDAASTGLLLLTNDGELTQQLTHPKHGVPKTYYVVVAGQMESDELRRLRRGVYLSDGVARVDNVKIRHARKNSTELEITLSEGKNREIRRVLARVGHKVVTLRRISIGPLKLGNMPEAAYRPLSKDEIAELYHAVEDARKARKLRKKEQVTRSREKAAREDAKSPSVTSLRPSDRREGDAGATESESRKRRVKLGQPSASSDRRSKEPAVQEPSSSPRDPFAWDDDDELLKANPFGPHHRFPSSENVDDDDEEEWDDSIEIDDAEDETEPAFEAEDGLLVDDRQGMRVGRVLDYEEGEGKPKPSRGRTKKAGAGNARRVSKKTSRKAPRPFDQARGSKKKPLTTGKKKFGTAKASKRGGFKKAGPKAGQPRSSQPRSKRSSKSATPRSTGRQKRR